MYILEMNLAEYLCLIYIHSSTLTWWLFHQYLSSELNPVQDEMISHCLRNLHLENNFPRHDMRRRGVHHEHRRREYNCMQYSSSASHAFNMKDEQDDVQVHRFCYDVSVCMHVGEQKFIITLFLRLVQQPYLLFHGIISTMPPTANYFTTHKVKVCFLWKIHAKNHITFSVPPTVSPQQNHNPKTRRQRKFSFRLSS